MFDQQGRERAREEEVVADCALEPPAKKQRVPSYDMLLALDHILEVIGDFSLPTFQPHEEKQNKPEELPRMLDLPTLVCVSDTGSDMYCPMWFLLSHCRTRLLHFPDPRHRLVREQCNAAVHSGLRGCLALADVVLQFFLGPWEDHKWWQVVKEETEEYLSFAKEASKSGTFHGGNALVRHLLPKIAHEQGWREDEATVARAHEALSEAKFLKRRGITGNSSRWNEFYWSFHERRKEFSLLLLILLSYGLKMGYVEDRNAPTLEALQKPTARAAKSAGEAATLKEAKMRIRAYFDKCKNRLHVATVCLSNVQLMQKLHVWFFASGPLALELDEVRRSVRGQKATLEYYQNLASGKHLHHLDKTLMILSNEDAFSGCGILQGTDVSGQKRYENLFIDEPVVSQQDEVMRLLVSCALNIAHFKANNLSLHLLVFPMRFAVLTMNNSSENKILLQDLKLLWMAWQKAQTCSGKYWKSFCQRSCLRLTVVSEICERLAKNEWSDVPEDISDFLAQCFSNIGCTWNEEGFNANRRVETQEHKKSRMSNVDVWQNASHSKVLEIAGLREVQVDPALHVSAHDLPESLFHTKRRTGGSEELKKIMGRQNWYSPKPIQASNQAADLMVLLESHRNNAWDEAAATWRTSLLTLGLVCKKKKEETIYLSLGPLPNGSCACLLPLRKYSHTKKIVTWDIDVPLSKEKILWVVVFDFAEWEVLPTRIVSPLHVAVLLAKKEKPQFPDRCGPWMQTAAKPVGLLRYCAEHGFQDIAASVLERLYKDIKKKCLCESRLNAALLD